MGGFATAPLAIAVSRAGGLGQIGARDDMNDLDAQLTKVNQSLDRTKEGFLPIGVGIMVFVTKIDDAIAVLERHNPASVWLFAAKTLDDYATWTKRLRAALPKSQLWIQVGSVAAALTVAKDAKPDVLCVQGSDAGGHGYEKGAGIISLLPETASALAANGHSNIHLVAAGGISEGRAAAAAFTLGAQGVVMGTRFLSAPETNMHPTYRKAIIAASDGGQSTIRGKVFDELRGPNFWPGEYDGRSIVQESWVDHERGVGIEEIRERHAEALEGEDGGFGVGVGKGRAATWAGTGVGLVRSEQAAGEIVEEVRREVGEVFEEVRARL